MVAIAGVAAPAPPRRAVCGWGGALQARCQHDSGTGTVLGLDRPRRVVARHPAGGGQDGHAPFIDARHGARYSARSPAPPAGVRTDGSHPVSLPARQRHRHAPVRSPAAGMGSVQSRGEPTGGRTGTGTAHVPAITACTTAPARESCGRGGHIPGIGDGRQRHRHGPLDRPRRGRR